MHVHLLSRCLVRRPLSLPESSYPLALRLLPVHLLLPLTYHLALWELPTLTCLHILFCSHARVVLTLFVLLFHSAFSHRRMHASTSKSSFFSHILANGWVVPRNQGLKSTFLSICHGGWWFQKSTSHSHFLLVAFLF